ncbi:MFS transporter [Acuticoccus mangrovi]|uniref:MFS transporter n=1 Tax=Acuticoccus mangrovi TaxID=2796142 RepID=A0A934IEK4_9HYPH|nr:MFS transporter [Acuticoccus mangrovi]MBJ3775098.1 MFS transporter [Acuticoccus mangrovi]
MPPLRAAGYCATSVVLALAQGFGQSLVSSNVNVLQGSFGATQAEVTWLAAAYLAPNVSLTLALVKIRAQYGLRNFAELSILGFVLAAILNYTAHDLDAAIAVRFMSGMAAAPMTSLAFLYMLEPLPPRLKLGVGLSAALTFIMLGPTVTRLISPHLLDIGLWHGLTAMEMALAMIGFGLIYLLPLNSPPRHKVIEAADVVSYFLIAIGFGSVAVVLTLGTLYWWLEAPWLGWLVVVAAATLTLAAVIELNRKNPLLDIRWLASPQIVHFAGALLLFRIVLSEQTSGAAGLFRTLGYLNADMQTLYVVILVASLAGGLVCAVSMRPGKEPWFHSVALLLIIVGAVMDSTITSATRPDDLLLSQGMIAFASALFLPPAMMRGLMAALAKGREYILSFIIVFLVTQKLGGTLGAAVFGTFVRLRQQLHLTRIVEGFALGDTLVTERLATLTGVYGATMPDAANRAAQAAAQLKSEATREAVVLAYADAFRVIAVITALALAGLFIHLAADYVRARLAPGRAAERA